MTNPDILKQKIKSLKQIWDNQSETYIRTYPDKKLKIDTKMNEQSFSNLVDTYSKMVSLNAQILGVSTGVNENLKEWENKLVNLKNAIGNNKQSLMIGCFVEPD